MNQVLILDTLIPLNEVNQALIGWPFIAESYQIQSKLITENSYKVQTELKPFAFFKKIYKRIL